MAYRGRLSAICAAAAGQRLDPLDLFARLLVEGDVPEVDVAVKARVWVVLVVGSFACVEGIAGWRYSVLVHSDLQVLWAVPPGSLDPPAGASYVINSRIIPCAY